MDPSVSPHSAVASAKQASAVAGRVATRMLIRTKLCQMAVVDVDVVDEENVADGG